MNYLQKISILFLSLVLLNSSCEKDKPDESETLPPLTTEGKNTFGCYVNGEPYVAKVNFTIGGPIAVGGLYNEITGELGIEGSRNIENNDKVTIHTFIDNKIGPYIMTTTNNAYKGYTNFTYYNQPCYNYYYNLNNFGHGTIFYLDTIKNIISGTFEMDLINPDCTADSIMHITDGRFDFGY